MDTVVLCGYNCRNLMTVFSRLVNNVKEVKQSDLKVLKFIKIVLRTFFF
jgi:hypothetical protein